MLTKDWMKKDSFFLAGYTQLGPTKEGPTQKWPAMTAYDFHFFIIEYFSTKKTEKCATY